MVTGALEQEQVGTIDRICFVRWSGRPTGDEARRVAEGIIGARRRVGHPLVLVAMIPPSAKLPDADARQELQKQTPIIDRMCESQYVVLEGDTIANALVRGAVTAVTILLRAPVIVLPTVQAALDHACARLGLEPATVLAEARARRLVSA
jgi:hypothetical protein